MSEKHHKRRYHDQESDRKRTRERSYDPGSHKRYRHEEPSTSTERFHSSDIEKHHKDRSYKDSVGENLQRNDKEHNLSEDFNYLQHKHSLSKIFFRDEGLIRRFVKFCFS
jgi:hypothetical protein